MGGDIGGTYRVALRGAVDRAAIPYGYTALNVMTGGMLIRTHGAPGTGSALLFLCGATCGFAAVTLLAAGPGAPPIAGTTAQGLWSGAAALVAFAAAALLAHAIRGPVAFGVVALAVTAAYLGVCSLGAALDLNERRADVHPD